MLDNTKNFFIVLLDDVKRLLRAFEIISILVTIGYSIAAIILEVGNLWVNVAILSFVTIYGILKLIFRNPNIDTAYKAIQLAISAISLAISIYGIYISTSSANGVVIIMSTLMIIFWVLKFMTLTIQLILNKHVKILKACAYEDLRPVFKALHAKNVFLGKDDGYSELDAKMAAKMDDLEADALRIKGKKENTKIKEKLKENKIVRDNTIGTIDLDYAIKNGLKDTLIDKSTYIKSLLSLDKSHKVYNRLNPLVANEGEIAITAISVVNRYLKENDLNRDYLVKLMVDDNLDYNEYLDHANSDLPKVLILLQKIIYIYGFPEIRPNLPLNPNTLDALKKALGVILGNKDYYHELYLLAKSDSNPLNTTKRVFKDLKGGIDNVNKQFFKKKSE